MDTIRLSFGRYPSDNQTLLVHLIVPYSVPIQWSSNPLRSKAHCNRTLYRCKALYSIMNHFAGNCKFSLSTIVDIFICRNRLVSYTLEKQELFIKFELWKPKTSNFAKKTSCFSWNALVDIHQNFICSSHSLNRKKRSESAQTAFMPLLTHTASHFCYSIDNPQGYLCRPWSIFIVQYTALTPSNH